MEYIRVSAKTVDDAIIEASIQLETSSDNIEFEVVETTEATKGNTTNNALKDATIETGYVVKVPMFISQGEHIIISTKDGKYSSRA